MNYLRICRYLYAKRFWNEIILLVQLVFMLIFAFTVLNPIDEFLQKKQKIVNSYDIDFDEALHFNMGNFVYEYQWQHYGENSLTDDIYEKIIETEGVGLVFQSGTATINYNTNKTDDAGSAVYSNALSFLYNDEMAHNVNFKLKSGKISYDVDGGIPILVSEILERELPVGTQTEVFDMDGKAVKCVVTGVLKKNEALPLINSYGSSESLGTLGVIPENSGCNRYMVMYDLKKDMDFEVDLGAKFIVLPESGYDRQKLKEGLEENVGNYGYVEETDLILKNSFMNMLRENAKYIIAFVMIAAIAVFGYGGYMYLMIVQHQKEFGIFYILGMSRKKMISVIFFSGLLLLVIAFLITFFSINVVMEKVFGLYNYQTGIFSYIFCAVIMGLILLTSVFVGFGQSKKLAEIAVYNGNEGE